MNILTNYLTNEMVKIEYSSIKECLKKLPFYIVTEFSGVFKIIHAERLNVIENGIEGLFTAYLVKDKFERTTLNETFPTYDKYNIIKMHISLSETDYTTEYTKTDYNEDGVNITIRKNVETEIKKDYYNISINGYIINSRNMIYDYGFLAVEKILP
jgi:hypothetical protein